MNKYRFKTENLADAEKTLAEILELVRGKGYSYVLLRGDLGAGKTTGIKIMAELLGCRDIVASPTFSLHNTYVSEGGETILHSDLYRINSLTELEQTGFFELLENADFAFIEWADKFNLKDMLERYAEISIIKGLEKPDSRAYEVTFSDE